MQKKTKLRVLRPTLREKKRYLVYSVDYFGNKALDYREFKNKANNDLLKFLGEYGYNNAGVLFVKGSGKKGIIRVDRKYVDHVKVGLMCINKIGKQNAMVSCIGVSGNINKAEQVYTC